jgi:diguanylate cyclase (GGDEF)-like protein
MSGTPGTDAPARRRSRTNAVADRLVAIAGDASPNGTRRSAGVLIVLLGLVGYALGFLLGNAAGALVEQVTAGALVVAILALLAFPVPEPMRWAGVVVMAPVAFAIGVRPLETPEAFVGLFLVPIAWVAAFLSARYVILHTFLASAAIAWVLSSGSFEGRQAVAAALWCVVAFSVAGLVATLARGLRHAREEADEIGEAVGIHLYRGVLDADNRYTETYTGVGLERLLGGPVPPGADAGVLWNNAIHPDDCGNVSAWLREIGAGASAERDYRMVGLDGTTRWVRDRTRVIASDGRTVVHEGVVTDITERKHAEQGLARARQDLQDVIETIDEVVLRYVPGQGAWKATVKGPGLAELLGPLAAQAGDPLDTVALALDRTRLAQHRRRALEEGRSEIEVRVAGVGGRRWIAERLRARVETGGWVVAATLVDVTERRLIAAELAAARDEAERRARTDALTNLANRLHFGEILDVAVDRHQRDGSVFGLVLVDVDRFKAINDEHGHLVGDRVLVDVASRLVTRLRDADAAARWGGEEFAILVAGTSRSGELVAAAEGIRDAVTSAPVAAGGNVLPVTVSIGAALAGLHGRTADELLAAADAALYRAKAAGRNRVELAGDAEAGALAG